MNLIYSEARRSVLDLMTLSDSGTDDFDMKVRDAARAALTELEPKSFNPMVLSTRVYKDRSTAGTAVYLEATADKRVLRFVDENGDPEPLPWMPEIDGSWDRIMAIALTITSNSGSEEFRVNAWEFFHVVSVGDGTDYYYVSIDRPWRNTTDTQMSFRIYMPYVWLPNWSNGIAGTYAGRIYHDRETPLELVSGAQLDVTARETGTGTPLQIGEKVSTRIPPLRKAVRAVSDENGASWEGPEQEGIWAFYATVVGGRMDSTYNIGGTEIIDPVFESAPTPVSEDFSHIDNPGVSIILTAANPDQMLNFDEAGALREGHTGLRVRFYAVCRQLRAAGAGSRNQVSPDDIPYLLAEVDPVPGDTEITYTWRGESLDRLRVMYSSGEQKGFALFPRPDDDYVIDLNLIRRLSAFWSDDDPLPLREEAYQAFIYLWAANLGPRVGIGLQDAETWRAYGINQLRRAHAEDATMGPIRTSGFRTLPIAHPYRKFRLVT